MGTKTISKIYCDDFHYEVGEREITEITDNTGEYPCFSIFKKDGLWKMVYAPTIIAVYMDYKEVPSSTGVGTI